MIYAGRVPVRLVRADFRLDREKRVRGGEAERHDVRAREYHNATTLTSTCELYF